MDPNACLTELLQLAAEGIRRSDIDEASLNADKTDRMCELVQALDGWLSKGGFLPQAWGEAQQFGQFCENSFQPRVSSDAALDAAEAEGEDTSR